MTERARLVGVSNENLTSFEPNQPPVPRVDSGGGPPYDGDMELLRRVEKLESLAEKSNDRLATLEKDVAVIRSNYATKADVEGAKTAVSEAKSSIIQWVVGAILISQLLPAIPNILRAFKLIP